jgi:hypothetical protein
MEAMFDRSHKTACMISTEVVYEGDYTKVQVLVDARAGRARETGFRCTVVPLHVLSFFLLSSLPRHINVSRRWFIPSSTARRGIHIQNFGQFLPDPNTQLRHNIYRQHLVHHSFTLSSLSCSALVLQPLPYHFQPHQDEILICYRSRHYHSFCSDKSRQPGSSMDPSSVRL